MTCLQGLRDRVFRGLRNAGPGVGRRETQQRRGQKRRGRPAAGLPAGWARSATPGSCFSCPFLEAPNATVSATLVSRAHVQLPSIPGAVLSDIWSPSLCLYCPHPQSHLFQTKPLITLSLDDFPAPPPLWVITFWLLKPPKIKGMKPNVERQHFRSQEYILLLSLLLSQ